MNAERGEKHYSMQIGAPIDIVEWAIAHSYLIGRTQQEQTFLISKSIC